MPNSSEDGDKTSNKQPRTLSLFQSLLAGSAASLSSRTATYPFDTVKARLQVIGAVAKNSGAPYTTTFNALQRIIAQEGIHGLYRGYLTVAVASLPATSAYYCGYETGKRFVPMAMPQYSQVVQDMCTGLVAQLIAGVVFTGVDLVKERMQVAPIMGRQQTHATDVVRDLFRARGLRGLLTGYWVTNAVWIPWNALYTATYERLKAYSAAHHVQIPSSVTVVGSSLVAASAAAVVTHPIDTVKLRVQVLQTKQGASPTALHVVRDLWAQEGARGFMRGLTARLLTIAPGTAISWWVYEHLKQTFTSL